MKIFKWQVLLGFLLVLLSVVFYIVHYIIFKDAHHIFIYLLGDIAFVPIEVFMVTIIIHRLLNKREKRIMLEKLNMIIGVFFSEVGTYLIEHVLSFTQCSGELKEDLVVKSDWSDREFFKASKKALQYNFEIDYRKCEWMNLKSFLLNKRTFLLGLLGNPNLLEHETFTELLRAVFHLTEELTRREDMTKLPDADYEHLGNDVKRAFGLLVSEWLQYMKHLKNNYPYMYSFAVRTNPFNRNASIIVK